MTPPTGPRRLSLQIAQILLSAALFPLCFEPIRAWPLLLVALPLFLHAISGTTARRAFYLGLAHGSLSLGLSLSWLFHIFGPASVVLFLLFGLFYANFSLISNALHRRYESCWSRVLIPTVLWVGFEFFRCEVFLLRFPWITPGTGMGPTWLSPLVGVYGMSFVIMLCTAAWLQRKSRLLVALPFTALILGLGLLRPGVISEPDKAGIRITVIQDEEAGLLEYITRTRDAVTNHSDLIIWPEYAVPNDVRKHQAAWKLITQLCADLDTMLLLGTRTDPQPGEDAWYNTALLIDQAGSIGEYYKARPLHFFDDGEAGTNFMPHATTLGRIATPICFDGDYTEVMRKMTAEGAEFFAMPVFDAKHWTAREHLQHAALLRCRAAETGRWIASAASSGVSQFIDPHGNVHADIAPMIQGALTYDVHRSTRMTLFVRFGWLLPWVNLAACGGLIILTFLAARRRPAEANSLSQEGID